MNPDRFIICFIIGLVALMLLSPVGCYVGSNIEYSDGYRDGTIQKSSKKGVIFKTYEGEMILGGFTSDGEGNFNRDKFFFTVVDPEVAAKIEALKPGKKVRIYYQQKLTTWKPKGDTSYFVTQVEELLK